MCQSVSEEEHKFGDRTFGSAVVTADHTCLKQMKPGFVTSHFYSTALALGDVDNDDSTFRGILQLADEPFLLGGIPGTESLEDYSLQPRNVQYGVDDTFLYAGEEGEHHDVGIEKVVRLHGT